MSRKRIHGRAGAFKITFTSVLAVRRPELRRAPSSPRLFIYFGVTFMPVFVTRHIGGSFAGDKPA